MINVICRGRKVPMFRANCPKCEGVLEYAKHDVRRAYDVIESGKLASRGWISCPVCGQRIEVENEF